MKQLSSLQLQLLDCLSDGNCHSGNAIGERIGVSRTAIWKQVSQLIDLGLNIRRIPQQGYQLTRPFKPINEELIRKNLELTRPLNFHIFAEIDSTNRFLKDANPCKEISVCCAEKQTNGRGRFGRQWVSPFGENIYLSTRWELNCCLSKLSGLSLVVSLAILDSLQKNSIQEDIRVKWPNDLLWNHKKLCGILIEINAETNGCAEVIIGIGLNVNTDTLNQPLADNAWCSLYEMTGNYFDRNVLIAELLRSLNQYLDQFMQNDFQFFQKRWQQVDYLDGHYITVLQARDSISGVAKGVTEFGQLCLIDDAGIEHYLSSGDTSLSKKE
ncbi:MAG: biotin--[acetyl-CoA-carboxylase] ligase [Legionella sp.]|nr:biotin--[acetyl-CoA-carboxylase] ligase [Legionella sp.]